MAGTEKSDPDLSDKNIAYMYIILLEEACRKDQVISALAGPLVLSQQCNTKTFVAGVTFKRR